MPTRYLVGDLGADILFEFIPYLEELWRTLRANEGRLVPRVRPARAGGNRGRAVLFAK